MVEWIVQKIEGKLAGVMRPTSMNFTAISLDIFRIISSDTLLPVDDVFVFFFSAAIFFLFSWSG